MKKIFCIVTFVILLIVWCNSAAATPVYFTDRVAFDAATGGGLSFESFETPFASTATVAFSGFSVSETGGNNQVHHQTLYRLGIL